jgi:hypothetical protein
MGRLQNNPSIGCVHPTSTHACPLTWGNNNDGFTKVMKRGFKVKNIKDQTPLEPSTNRSSKKDGRQGKYQPPHF